MKCALIMLVLCAGSLRAEEKTVAINIEPPKTLVQLKRFTAGDRILIEWKNQPLGTKSLHDWTIVEISPSQKWWKVRQQGNYELWVERADFNIVEILPPKKE